MMGWSPGCPRDGPRFELKKYNFWKRLGSSSTKFRNIFHRVSGSNLWDVLLLGHTGALFAVLRAGTRALRYVIRLN